MGGKVCLRCKGKTLLGVVNKLLKTKKFFDITQQCFALLPQVNIPANKLNFHWRWWDRIQTIFLNLFYFNCRQRYTRKNKKNTIPGSHENSLPPWNVINTPKIHPKVPLFLQERKKDVKWQPVYAFIPNLFALTRDFFVSKQNDKYSSFFSDATSL